MSTNPAFPAQIQLGGYISVRTTFSDEEIQGEVFCYDVANSNVLVLKEHRDNGNVNFRVIRIAAIKHVASQARPPDRPSRRENGKERIEDVSPLDPTFTTLPGCDHAVLERRERRAIEAFQQREHTIGVGVTREAQDIFDFIHKTHPNCRWENDAIVVMGVKVVPPYSPDSCSTTGAEERAIDRLRKVLSGFHTRRQKKKVGSDAHSRPISNTPHRPNNIRTVAPDSNSTCARPSSVANAGGMVWSYDSGKGQNHLDPTLEQSRNETKFSAEKGKAGGGYSRKNQPDTNVATNAELEIGSQPSKAAALGRQEPNQRVTPSATVVSAPSGTPEWRVSHQKNNRGQEKGKFFSDANNSELLLNGQTGSAGVSAKMGPIPSNSIPGDESNTLEDKIKTGPTPPSETFPNKGVARGPASTAAHPLFGTGRGARESGVWHAKGLKEKTVTNEKGTKLTATTDIERKPAANSSVIPPTNVKPSPQRNQPVAPSSSDDDGDSNERSSSSSRQSRSSSRSGRARALNAKVSGQ